MRKLKSFVRLDGNNNIISSSNVLRHKKPTVGNWVEVNSTLCCNAPVVVLKSFGTTGLMGLENTCTNNPENTLLYFDGAGVLPTIGDRVFYDQAGTLPVITGVYNLSLSYFETLNEVIVSFDECR